MPAYSHAITCKDAQAAGQEEAHCYHKENGKQGKKTAQHEKTMDKVHHRDRFVPVVSDLGKELVGTYRCPVHIRRVHNEEDSLAVVEEL